jgi:hypothetical protein
MLRFLIEVPGRRRVLEAAGPSEAAERLRARAMQAPLAVPTPRPSRTRKQASGWGRSLRLSAMSLPVAAWRPRRGSRRVSVKG